MVSGSLCSAVLAAAILLLHASIANAHGWLAVPRSRNLIVNGPTYDASAGNGLGFSNPVGNPGVCGDPYQAQSTNYAGRAFASQATYTSGSNIDIAVDLNVNHGGRFEFFLCNRNSGLDQACFNQNRLNRADNNSPFSYILTGTFAERSVTSPRRFTLTYKLPAGLSCPSGCVLQWRYKTYNSCVDPCPASECGFYAARRNDITGQTGPLDFCGAVVPEVFQNCADITITGGAPAPNPTTPTPGPTPGPTTGVCASGGQCGAGICSCGSGQCCSQYGYCGTTAAHCGAGCRVGFGACSGSAPAPSTPVTSVQCPLGGSCGPGNCACINGQCCSQHGFCGTSAAHCGAGCKRGYGACS